MAETYDVHGLKDIERALKRLPEKVEQQILRSMVRAGGQVVRKAAVAKGGLDKNALLVRASRSKSKRGRQVVSVGIAGDFFYLQFKEEGTAPHIVQVKEKTRLSFDQRKRKVLSDGSTIYGMRVQHPGQQPEPFLRPALHENVNKVVEAMRKQAAKRFHKIGKSL